MGFRCKKKSPRRRGLALIRGACRGLGPRQASVDRAYLGEMVTVDELFAGFVSVPVNVAEPVVGKDPAVGPTLKFTVTIEVAPPATVPRLQVMAFPTLLQPVPVTELSVKLDGSVDVNTTQLAAVVPRLFLICHVRVSPEFTAGPPFCADPIT